jgi:hypothetical protein
VSRSRVKGDVGVRKLLRQLPDAAREGMADILDDYGSKLLLAMQRDIPVDTGTLKSRLSKKLSRKTLQLKVGFVGKRANGEITRKVTERSNIVHGGRRKLNDQFVGGQFYGRFVEFGRKAQTVRVTRRAKLLRITGNNKTAANRRQHIYGSGVYSMKVKAMAARPFIFKKRPQLRQELSTKLRTYWDNTLKAAAAGVSFDD